MGWFKLISLSILSIFLRILLLLIPGSFGCRRCGCVVFGQQWSIQYKNVHMPGPYCKRCSRIISEHYSNMDAGWYPVTELGKTHKAVQ